MVCEGRQVGQVWLVLEISVLEVQSSTASVQVEAGHDQQVFSLTEAIRKPEILLVVGNFAQPACFPFQNLQTGAGVSQVDLITASISA